MNTSCKTLGIGITLLCCLMAPQLTAAVSGCNNGCLLGTYNAEVTSLNLQNVLQAVNNTDRTTSPTTTPAVVGFGSNPRSLSGTTPGASRLYFDGNGTIVGATALSTGTMSVAAGTYSVNLDCTATISLATGSSFDAIIAGGGRQVLFVETDSTGTGSTGILERASSCVSLSYPQSFGFSCSGALQAAASTTGTGGTTTTAAAQFMPFSLLGTISTDGNGNFTYTQTAVTNGAVSRAKAGGTYSVGADCSVKLSFSANSPGTTANFKSPGTLSGLTTDSTGGVPVLQTDPNTAYTGWFVVQ